MKVIQADGHSITYTYNADDRLISYVDAAGYTYSFTYDGNGNKLSETDGNGNTTYYTYDGLDRLISKTDAEGSVSSKTYDADGRLIKVINEEGAQTHYIYDDCGRIVKMTDALGNETIYTYDEMDRVLTVTDARGGVTSYTYTNRGDVATETNAEGYTVSYEYDGSRNMVKKTTVDGSTTYTYDALDRLISIATPDGKTETFEYNGEGKIIGSTDKGGHKTSYILDKNGNIIETLDAMGNSALFEYDSMNNLIKTSMHRIDTQDTVDEWEITLYEFDGRGLVTREVNALGNVTTYTYDGNGNLKSKTDADGKVTAYAYNGLDMITHINYNGGKEVSYRYNKVGDLVEMTDWTGKTSFEVDLLNRITKATDTKGKIVEYTYDEVGNQTLVKYPDNTTATKTYDLLGNLKSVTEADGRTTRYTYDGMNRISKMEYPHGWVEDYQYDSVGQLLKVTDTDPTNNDMKQQKHAYAYDDCGNMTYEYMRGNGTGEATVENTYTYDALHRVTSAHENYGNKTRTYQYDSLGNLTYETELGNKSIDYKLNNLNQITKKSEDGWKTQNDFTYDRRGNLIRETNTKSGKVSVIGEYTYDETNKMVLGVNELGESSAYLYNGLGALVENTWVIKKNAYGYHDVSALTTMVEGEVVVDPQTGKKDKKDKLAPEVVAASPELNKTSTVVKQFVVDYTNETLEPLMEYEVNGLEYRYVYGNDRLSVNITGVDTSAGNLIENGNQIRLYYHMDYLGTADYLTSPITGKVESWTHYNEWGEITHNAVLKSGQRELDMVKRYATHDHDSVLGMYYAKARFYDAGDRRFTAMDPVKGNIMEPMSMVQYLYVINNPTNYIDLLGEYYIQWALTLNEIPGKPLHFEITKTEYTAIPESESSAYIKTAIQSVAPFGLGDMLLEWYTDNSYVGGNSMYDVDFSDLMAGLYEDMLMDEGFKTISKKFGSDLSPIYTIYDTIMTFDENIRIPMMDKEVFKLLNLSGINLVRSSVEEVEYIMDRSYIYTALIAEYVFGHKWNIDPGPDVFINLASPTFLDMDIAILNSKNKEKTIKRYVDRYFGALLCKNKNSYIKYSENQIIDDLEEFDKYLRNYEQRLKFYTELMIEFVEPKTK